MAKKEGHTTWRQYRESGPSLGKSGTKPEESDLSSNGYDLEGFSGYSRSRQSSAPEALSIKEFTTTENEFRISITNHVLSLMRIDGNLNRVNKSPTELIDSFVTSEKVDRFLKGLGETDLFEYVIDSVDIKINELFYAYGQGQTGELSRKEMESINSLKILRKREIKKSDVLTALQTRFNDPVDKHLKEVDRMPRGTN